VPHQRVKALLGLGVVTFLIAHASRIAQMWTLRDTEKDNETVQQIDREGDRAAAILAGGYLEDRLMIAIQSRLIQDKRVINQFFRGIGPLATFSAKIDLAYLLAILDERTQKHMHIIRRIRNEYAHELSEITFETQKIKSLCRNLPSYSDHLNFKRLLNKTLSESPDTLTILNIFLDNILATPETARNQYMSCIKVINLILDLEATREFNKRGISTYLVFHASSHGKPSLPRLHRSQIGSRILKMLGYPPGSYVK
jgi:hypothetical protein